MQILPAVSHIPENINLPNGFFETNTLTNCLSIVSIILSFLAMIITLHYSRKAYEQAAKINEINIEIDYYKRIFDEYIIKDIPSARRKLILSSDNKISYQPYMELEQLLIKLLNDVYFFSFRNKEFYDDIKSIIIDLDDYMVMNCNKTFDDNSSSVFFARVDKYINRLYSQIFETAIKSDNR